VAERAASVTSGLRRQIANEVFAALADEAALQEPDKLILDEVDRAILARVENLQTVLHVPPNQSEEKEPADAPRAGLLFPT
jgi:hypothetical protein